MVGRVVVTVWALLTVFVTVEVVGIVVLQTVPMVFSALKVDVGPVATQEQKSVTSVSAIPIASVVPCVRMYWLREQSANASIPAKLFPFHRFLSVGSERATIVLTSIIVVVSVTVLGEPATVTVL